MTARITMAQIARGLGVSTLRIPVERMVGCVHQIFGGRGTACRHTFEIELVRRRSHGAAPAGRSAEALTP